MGLVLGLGFRFGDWLSGLFLGILFPMGWVLDFGYSVLGFGIRVRVYYWGEV